MVAEAVFALFPGLKGRETPGHRWPLGLREV